MDRFTVATKYWHRLDDGDEVEAYLSHLFHKAGLASTAWPHDLRAFVFTVEKFGRRALLGR